MAICFGHTVGDAGVKKESKKMVSIFFTLKGGPENCSVTVTATCARFTGGAQTKNVDYATDPTVANIDGVVWDGKPGKLTVTLQISGEAAGDDTRTIFCTMP